MIRPHSHPGYGALVISLDFELLWGLRDRLPNDGGAYRDNLLGARQAVPAMLSLFAEYDVAATWATVGCLFANGREDLAAYIPCTRPTYHNATLDPYDDQLGDCESDDPLHFAPSLIRQIVETPRQELASHTFSHYYCLEPGQTGDALRHDLRSAQAIAAKHGGRLRSIVFPRNQTNPAYGGIVAEAGFVCYRGNQHGNMHRAAASNVSDRIDRRASRLLDAYVPLAGSGIVPWQDVAQPDGMCNVPASLFLRPHSPGLRTIERMRLRRVAGTIERAAQNRAIVHLWWHPHNFGVHLEENMKFLRGILDVFATCRDQYGMRSLSMIEVAEIARGE